MLGDLCFFLHIPLLLARATEGAPHRRPEGGEGPLLLEGGEDHRAELEVLV